MTALGGAELGLGGLIIAGGIWAAGGDLASGRIANPRSLALALAGLAAHAVGGGWSGAVGWAEGLALALAAGFVLFAAGALGGGDAKLLAALGGMGGARFVPWLLFYAALAGGALALGKGILGGTLAEEIAAGLRRARGAPGPGETRAIPYGAAVALGGGWAWWALCRGGAPPGF